MKHWSYLARSTGRILALRQERLERAVSRMTDYKIESVLKGLSTQWPAWMADSDRVSRLREQARWWRKWLPWIS